MRRRCLGSVPNRTASTDGHRGAGTNGSAPNLNSTTADINGSAATDS